MKHVLMTRRNEPPPEQDPASKGKSEGAFDLWLKRGLHQLFDDVTNEPLPDALLKLIEDDRKK